MLDRSKWEKRVKAEMYSVSKTKGNYTKFQSWDNYISTTSCLCRDFSQGVWTVTAFDSVFEINFCSVHAQESWEWMPLQRKQLHDYALRAWQHEMFQSGQAACHSGLGLTIVKSCSNEIRGMHKKIHYGRSFVLVKKTGGYAVSTLNWNLFRKNMY